MIDTELKKIKQMLYGTLKDVKLAIETNDTQVLGERIESLRKEVEVSEDRERTFVENYNAKNVKWLREETGLGMLECKKALFSAKGNLDEALEYLRTGRYRGGMI